MSDSVIVTIGAPDNQTAVSVSSADRIFVDIAAGFTGQGGGGGGDTNLSTTRTATTVTVVSSTGTDATIPAADGTNAGVMTAAMQTKLAGIEAGAEVNDTASEILTKLLTVDGSGSGLDADTLDGVHASALVPYSGASGDVNLGEHGAQLGNLEFDNTPTNTPTTDGSVFWDSGDGTLQLQMKGGAIQQVGMNQFARVYNDTASAFTKGQVVYISGAQGNRIAAKLAQANSELTSRGTIGFVVESIAAGAEGNIIVSGHLYKLNTTGLTAGNPLYLSAATAGAYTETAPQAPDNGVVLGYVERVHGTVGSIYVKVDNGYELEELHDVDTTESKATPVDADALLLQDSADSSIWKRLTWANLKATAKTYFDSLYVAGNTAITGATKTKITYDSKGLVTAGADAGIADITGLQTALDGKVDENAAITGATKTKITYDSKGLVTAGADATTADIADSTNRRYVTDAQLTVIGNTSGTNTGDQNLFGKVAVSGQSDVVADGTNDTLTLVAGSNITITTDASTDSITIASSGGSSGGTVLSPSQLTAWQNNYNPTSWGSGVQTLRIDSDSNYNFLTGLTATTGGHRVKLLNIGSYAFGLQDDEDDSTAANRFSFNGQDVIVLPGRMVELEYDSTSSRWRLASAYHINFESPEYAQTAEMRFMQTTVNISSAFNILPFVWQGSASPGRALQTVGTSGFRGRYSVISLSISNNNNSYIGSVGTSGNTFTQFTFNDDTNFGYHVFENNVRFEDLSTSTERYIARFGWLDVDNAAATDGLYLQYTDNENSGQWTFLAYNNTSATTVNTTSAVAADTWYRLRIVVYSNGTAKAYVNGALVGEIASGLPAAGRDFGVYSGFRKTVGTTTRTMYESYIKTTNISAYPR